MKQITDRELKIEVVGSFLHYLFLDKEYNKKLPYRCCETLIHMTSPTASIVDVSHDYLYSVPGFNQGKLTRLVLGIYGGPPEPLEFLRCCQTTTEEDLHVFMKRVQSHPRKYIILQVNHLPYHLQEVRNHAKYIPSSIVSTILLSQVHCFYGTV